MNNDDSPIQNIVQQYGIQQYWSFPEDFELSASECITLKELKNRWPSLTEEFINKNMGHEDKPLPIAGLINIFDDGRTFHCKPIFGFFEYLLLPECHPEYITQYPRSYQCFAKQYGIKDFVLPRTLVEQYEQAHPEVLRQIAQEKGEEADDETLKRVAQVLNSMPEEDLITNKKQIIAAVLHIIGVKAQASHVLIAGKKDIELNSMQTNIRRWRDLGLELLRLPSSSE